MAKTKVLEAPYDSDGSLMHFPGDARKFSHYEDKTTGDRLERSQIWESIPVPEREPQERFSTIERVIHHDWRAVHTGPDWRPNEPFHATLQVCDLRSGQSAKYVLLRPVAMPLDLRTYPMFIADLIDLLKTGHIMQGGIASERWMVAKRGQNYGLRVARKEE